MIYLPFSIMKARKTMKNQPLIQEVISQISQRFAPKIPDIKKVRLSVTGVVRAVQAQACIPRRSTHCLRKSTLNEWRVRGTRLHMLHRCTASFDDIERSQDVFLYSTMRM